MKMHQRCSVLLLLVFIFTSVFSQTGNNVAVYSEKMKKKINNIVILPKDYDQNTTYPVLYLLHGYGGKQDTWIAIKPNLSEEATRLGMIIVCPDGRNSWYWDSPINSESQYETYVSKELVDYIDTKYSTVKSKKGRAVTGLSMGGHGGLWLGINHQDVFGACGSMSGGVDIRPFPNNWEMKKSIGEYKTNPESWNQYTVMEQLYKIQPGALAIIIDCGVNDFFFEVNEELHKRMLYNNIIHDYIVRPGKHDSDYWKNAIDYQLMFFAKFFANK